MLKKIALLMVLIIILASFISGCNYSGPPEEGKPKRGPLHYQGPDINGFGNLTPEDEDDVDEEAEADEESPSPGDYFSILYWLPFERSLWGEQNNEDEEEVLEDEYEDFWDTYFSEERENETIPDEQPSRDTSDGIGL